MSVSVPVLLVVLGAALPAPVAVAPDDDAPGPGLGPILGAATALVPLAVGGALMTNDNRPAREEAGIYVMMSGLALAPWVAHGIEGRWERALAYGGASLALSAGVVIAMNRSDAFDPTVGNHVRQPMLILLPLALASASLGVVTSVFDGPPKEAPTRGLALWATPLPGGWSTGLAWSLPP